MTEAGQAPPGVDPSTPSPARLYDYFLGGSSNFPADRAAGDRLREALPDLYDSAWANRGFHQRSARWMASEQGIGQFIDIGCGLPTKGTTYQAISPVARTRAWRTWTTTRWCAPCPGNCSPTTRTPG